MTASGDGRGQAAEPNTLKGAAGSLSNDVEPEKVS
jgi:hypothetical protein